MHLLGVGGRGADRLFEGSLLQLLRWLLDPAEYLLHWRVSIAQSMLLSGASIETASEKLGYASAASFARAFAQSVGSSSRAWLQGRQAAMALPVSP